MQDTLPAPILNNTFTLTELYRRADLLQRFFEHLFFDSKTAAEGERIRSLRSYYQGASDEVREHVEAVVAWGEEGLAPFSANNVYDGIRALKRTAESLPRFTLYVPVLFTPAQVDPIGEWCRTHVDPNIMLDMKLDPEVVGGCAYVYQNAYHDFSLSYFVNKERQAFLSLVHDYGT